jgi:serine/threonine-protein kinase
MPARATPEAEPLTLHRWVGRYELIHRLAHGGMATVYLGRAKGKAGFEKVVAVKVIHPHLASEAEFVGMFLDEARIAARIHHPHVVEILDLGESEGGYYMVMEFIEGENLAALVRALAGSPKRLPITVILQLLADTLEGLAAAHELCDVHGRPYHLVHRDVSPHNILINLDGWAKVADFGIMKAAGKASNTKTGELRGKLAYMSPEQARGGAVDPRSDLFAVGVIAWELLTGQRLFACTTEAATLEKVIACEVPPLDPVAHGRPELVDAVELREGLDALLAKALAPRADSRYADAKQMLAEIRRLRRLGFDLLGESREPRKQLGALMARFFKTRVDYARMALRRTGEHEALPSDASPIQAGESATAPARWGIEPTMQVERAAPQRPSQIPTESHTPLPLDILESSGATPIASASPSVSQTPVTGSNPSVIIQQAPSSRLVQWVVLPMLGAAIAIMAMLLLDRTGKPVDEPQRVEPPREAEPPRSSTPSLAATEYQLPPPRTPGQVSWCFSTTPPGAVIRVAGVEQSEPTPSCVSVPAGKQPIGVELELAGYELLRLDLTPVADQSFPEQLTPLAPRELVRDRARVRKPSTGKDKPLVEEKKDTKSGFIPPPDSLRDDPEQPPAKGGG